jgi:Tfp pilus assembly protein PilF
MSLLMDALKRAEASKKEAQRAAAENPPPATPAPPAGGLSLEPLSGAGAPGGKSLPDLADHIAALDAELADSRQPEPTVRKAPPSRTPDAGERGPTAGTAEAEKQAAARNAFAAKLAAKPSQRPLWLVLGTLGVAAAGIGAYVWYQVQAMSGGSLAPTARSSPPPEVRPAPSGAPVTAPAPSPATAPGNVALFSGSTANDPAARPARAIPLPPPAPGADSPARPAPRAEAARGLAGSAPGPASVPIRLTRNQTRPDANAQAGYSKLQGNQLEAARQDYELALQADPNNVDTLLALAAIAQRQGRPGDASRYQQRAIEADPRDPAAQAALIGSASGGDQANNESRLKTLLAAQPESGPLNFALGNLFARQARWPEAQPLYFNAVAAEPDNPDYLFNLAVSLDHLRQPKVAAQHYRLALEAAQRRPPAFDLEQARARLGQLSAASHPR